MERSLISIPEYFKTYVDPNTDLTEVHNIPCPFHNEQSGKSFTYSPDKNVWRCWGACHAGGDVIELHRLHYHLHSRAEAQKSLYRLLGMEEELKPSFKQPELHVNEEDVKRRELYAKAVHRAVTVDDWIALDYILSQVPFNIDDIEEFIHLRSDNVNV